MDELAEPLLAIFGKVCLSWGGNRDGGSEFQKIGVKQGTNTQLSFQQTEGW